MQEPLPRRRGLAEMLVLLIRLVVELAATAVDVNLRDLDPAGTRARVLEALPEIADHVEKDDDREGEVVVEPALDARGRGLALDGALDGNVELWILSVYRLCWVGQVTFGDVPER